MYCKYTTVEPGKSNASEIATSPGDQTTNEKCLNCQAVGGGRGVLRLTRQDRRLTMLIKGSNGLLMKGSTGLLIKGSSGLPMKCSRGFKNEVVDKNQKVPEKKPLVPLCLNQPFVSKLNSAGLGENTAGNDCYRSKEC